MKSYRKRKALDYHIFCGIYIPKFSGFKKFLCKLTLPRLSQNTKQIKATFQKRKTNNLIHAKIN